MQWRNSVRKMINAGGCERKTLNWDAWKKQTEEASP